MTRFVQMKRYGINHDDIRKNPDLGTRRIHLAKGMPMGKWAACCIHSLQVRQGGTPTAQPQRRCIGSVSDYRYLVTHIPYFSHRILASPKPSSVCRQHCSKQLHGDLLEFTMQLWTYYAAGSPCTTYLPTSQRIRFAFLWYHKI